MYEISTFPKDSIVKPHPLWTPPKYDLNPFYPKTENVIQLETYIYNSIKFI